MIDIEDALNSKQKRRRPLTELSGVLEDIWGILYSDEMVINLIQVLISRRLHSGSRLMQKSIQDITML